MAMIRMNSRATTGLPTDPREAADGGVASVSMEPARRADLEHELRARGYRVTSTRRAVWDVLRFAHRHLTAYEIVARTDAAGRRVDLASVYRTLDLLEDLGLARRSRLLRSEADSWEVAHADEHFHMECIHCGDVDHHVGALVAVIEDHLGKDHGFDVYEVELRVAGRCATCREPRASGRRA